MMSSSEEPRSNEDTELTNWGAAIRGASERRRGALYHSFSRGSQGHPTRRLAVAAVLLTVLGAASVAAMLGQGSEGDVQLGAGGGAETSGVPVTTGPDLRPPCSPDDSSTTTAPQTIPDDAPPSLPPPTYPPVSPLPETPATSDPPPTSEHAAGLLDPDPGAPRLVAFSQGPSSTVSPTTSASTTPPPTTVIPEESTTSQSTSTTAGPPETTASTAPPPPSSTGDPGPTESQPPTTSSTTPATVAPTDPPVSVMPTIPCQGGQDTSPGFHPIDAYVDVAIGDASARRFFPESLGPLVGREPNLHVMYRVTKGDEEVAIIAAHHASSNLVPLAKEPVNVDASERAAREGGTVAPTEVEGREVFVITTPRPSGQDQVTLLFDVGGAARVAVTGTDAKELRELISAADFKALLGV